MSKEFRQVSVGCTVNSPDNLPLKNGEQMYADDVMAELGDVVQEAVMAWYQRRGHQLLACEPT